MTLIRKFVFHYVAGLAMLFVANLDAAEPVGVACVGDSITFGYGLRDPQTEAYPVRLGHWLGTNYDVRNFGVNATTLLHRGDYPYIGRPAYTNALDFKADVVVIDFGANDSKHPGDGSLDPNAPDNWQHQADFFCLRPVPAARRPEGRAATGSDGLGGKQFVSHWRAGRHQHYRG